MDAMQKQQTLPREVWERVKKFLLPEDAMSLKLVFDNIRNYLICAAVIGAVGALSATSMNAGIASWPTTIIVVAVLLIGTNSLQTFLILDRVTSRIGRFQKEVRPKWGKVRRRLARLLIVVVMLPVVLSAFDLFHLLVQWAIQGGRQAGGL